MLAILQALAAFLSGLMAVANQYLSQKGIAQEETAGSNQQIVTEEAQKAKDEAIANEIDGQPVPVSKPAILSGM